MKTKNKFQFSPTLLRDIEDWTSLICQNCASQARDKLRSEQQWAIQNFYDSQEPKYYNRGFGLFNSFKPYYKNVRGKTFYGGITITPEPMKEDQRDPKDYVLKGALQGWHGTSAIQTNSPYEYILYVKDGIVKNPKSQIQKAKKETLLPKRLRSMFE